MPFGPGKPVPTAEVKRLLEAQGVRLAPDPTRGWGPAHHMRGAYDGGAAREDGLVGFIGAMTEGFCADCNRVRLGADGALRACLGGRDRVDLVALLRAGAGDAEVADRIREALLAKGERHAMADARGRLLPMVGVGG
jgi:cyclic pyranopterin phosphate synthase